MILVDTSVWVEHLRAPDASLLTALRGRQVLGHPFVTGELACGGLADRPATLALLDELPRVIVADDAEARFFLERHRLMRRGIGYIDVHLLASTALDRRARLWTLDRRLARVADELGLAYPGAN